MRIIIRKNFEHLQEDLKNIGFRVDNNFAVKDICLIELQLEIKNLQILQIENIELLDIHV